MKKFIVPYEVSEVYNSNVGKDDIDVLGILVELSLKWKQIFLIGFVGSLIFLIIAFRQPVSYVGEISLILPSEGQISILNNKAYVNYNALSVFRDFYDKTRSRENFKSFLEQENLLGVIFPNQQELGYSSSLFYTKAFNMISHKALIESNNEDQDSAEPISNISNIIGFLIKIQHSDQAIAVDVVERYIEYSRIELLKAYEKEQNVFVDVRKNILTREIKRLRAEAKRARQIAIRSKEGANALELEKLEQQKQLLVSRTNDDRLTTIEQMSEQNRISLLKLKQRRQILITTFNQSLSKQIQEVEEALVLAKVLSIVEPTPLDKVGSIGSNTDATTTISIETDDTTNWPLYTMGSKFLEGQLSILKGRKDNPIFVSGLSEIDSEIMLVTNDIGLQGLKQRESDEKYLKELNELEQKIKLLKNDKDLAELYNRENDDLQIPSLAQKLNELDDLVGYDLNFIGLELYQLEKPALITGEAMPNNRKFIAVGGFLFSGLVAVIIALFSIAFENRKKKESNNR